MNRRGWQRFFVALVLVAVAGCGSSGEPARIATIAEAQGSIIIAGSSTVYPITQRVADSFRSAGAPTSIEIQNVGTGGGFRAFCTGTAVDIVNASRAMNAAEQATCAAIGRYPVPIQVGVDALAVVVNAENDFVDRLSIEQLEQIFSGTAATWADIDPRYPAQPIVLFSPGVDSGTFDYFVEAVLAGDEARIPTTATFSEDDNQLVAGVAQNQYAIAYFGYAYYQQNRADLRAVPISREGRLPAIAPSEATVSNKTYPFSRPLYIYTSAEVVQSKPQVDYFIGYYLDHVTTLIGQVGYFAARRDTLEQGQYTLTRLRNRRGQLALR